CILYLAAAGVGTLGIVDSDIIDLSNLQRQVVHTTPEVGRPKTESTKERVAVLNPDVRVVEHRLRLTRENAAGIIQEYDFVIDGTDNFPTKYLVNDVCVRLGKPFSHAGILRFEGQILTVVPGVSACYRCLFPEEPPEGMVPSCQEGGVLGAVAGVMGSLQAIETLKWLLGVGELLKGRLLIYDALESTFRTVRIPKMNDCPVC
ncbi:MAG: ThiF family adenylyltransferase, partial [Candidatus Omnitrophica bacterium]|nr:ThiF family adenylyltransferase [Candidatus Omnitrophota bacterium]